MMNKMNKEKLTTDILIGSVGFVGSLTLERTLSIIVALLTIAVLLKRLFSKDKKDD